MRPAWLTLLLCLAVAPACRSKQRPQPPEVALHTTEPEPPMVEAVLVDQPYLTLPGGTAQGPFEHEPDMDAALEAATRDLKRPKKTVGLAVVAGAGTSIGRVRAFLERAARAGFERLYVTTQAGLVPLEVAIARSMKCANAHEWEARCAQPLLDVRRGEVAVTALDNADFRDEPCPIVAPTNKQVLDRLGTVPLPDLVKRWDRSEQRLPNCFAFQVVTRVDDAVSLGEWLSVAAAADGFLRARFVLAGPGPKGLPR